MNFKDTLTKLADADAAGILSLSVSEAMRIANLLSDPEPTAPVPTVLRTQADLMDYGRGLPEVMDNLATKKIVAIKALRTSVQNDPMVVLDSALAASSTNSDIPGLKAAKDACDSLAREADDLCPEGCGFSLDTYRSWAQCPHNAHNHRGY